ncbi:hypothetical protein C8K44_1564, partial [Aminobacter sp. AP02]
MKHLYVLVAALMAFAPMASAQNAPEKMSIEQIEEEKAYAAGIQVAFWGRPLVDNVHTLSAALKANAVGLNYFRKFSD